MKWKHSCTDPRYRPTYQSWVDMRKRCLYPHHHKYIHYGARGITVCERWINNFDTFITDMGIRPAGLTIERVDNNQGYDPFNCIWADLKTQANNKRKRPINQQRIDAINQKKQEVLERRLAREKAHADALASKPVYIPATPVHGSRKMYGKHKCRCSVCVIAWQTRRLRINVNIPGTKENMKKREYSKNYRLRQKLEYDL